MPGKNVYRTELTPVDFLRRNACVFPEKTAVVHRQRRYTYAAFAERVNRLPVNRITPLLTGVWQGHCFGPIL